MYPREEALIEHYDQHLEYYSVVSNKTLKDIFNWIGRIDNLSILDLGCGTGLFPNEAVKRGASCHGIDYSSNRITLAQSKYKHDNLLYSKTDVHEYVQHKSLKPDIITAWEVLEHLEEPTELVNLCRKKCSSMFGSVPLNSVYKAHLHVYKTLEDVQERLNPTEIRFYNNHALLYWRGDK